MPTPSTHDLTAIHDELLALIKAGLPLNTHLRLLAAELPAVLRAKVDELATRIEQGESLDNALRAAELNIDPIYDTVFGAMLSGKQPAKALELGVRTARLTNDFQQNLLSDMIYPLVLLCVGIGLARFSITNTMPAIYRGQATFHIFSEETTSPLTWLPVSKLFQLPLDLLGLGIGFAAVAYVVYAAGQTQGRQSWNMWPFGRLKVMSSLASFCHAMAILLENSVPLPKALSLAARGIPYPALSHSITELARRVERGESVPARLPPLSPMILWLLSSPGQTPRVNELRFEAERLLREVERQRNWYQLYLPIIITCVMGLVLLVALACANLVPYATLLKHLTNPLRYE